MGLVGHEFIQFGISEEEKENLQVVNEIDHFLEKRAKKVKHLRFECIRNKFGKLANVTLPLVLENYRKFRESEIRRKYDFFLDADP